MKTKQHACGTWESAITTGLLLSGSVGVSEVIPDGNDCWWAESRPSESGRTALMRWRDGEVTERSPAAANVRTAVHEYGGGSWWVDAGEAFYVDYTDQRLRCIKTDGTVSVLSPEPDSPKALRYADFRLSADRQWVIAVVEQHRAAANSGQAASAEPVNLIQAIATDGSGITHTLVQGADFYGSPRLSPDSSRLTWVQWQHPNMPWDDTELFVADISWPGSSAAAPQLQNMTLVAGGVGEAIVQPEWSPSGELHYLSDRNDWWHLYRENDATPVLEVDGEIGYPPWVFGLSRYCFKLGGEVVAAVFDGGVEKLELYPEGSAFHSLRSSGDKIAFVASSWTRESSVIFAGKVIKAPRDLGQLGIVEEYLQAPQVIEYPTTDKEVSHALFFPPANPACEPLPDEKPPLIVLAHGGPTSAARSQLSLARQFWTSRGFALVDVNYRGSSGFGRAYRKKLEGVWGVADVDDCVHAARHLADQGFVDAERLIIRGGSAGGYTVLCALAFHNTFTAGASLYGVADLEALAKDTHKFESRYLDSLIGAYPEQKALYQARSPINCLDGFSSPMIVLQGSDDAIVPPNQSRMIVDALDKKQVPVAYLEFAGEQHGFRKSETIKRALEAELEFYLRVFRLLSAGQFSDLEIRHLDESAV